MNSKKIILIIVVSCICLVMLIVAFLLGNKTKYYMNSGNIEIYGDYDKNDLDDEFFGVGNANIVFKNENISITGFGVSVDEDGIIINSSGIFVLSGKTSQKKILIDVNDNSYVKIILNGLELTNYNECPILIKNAKKTIITLVNGTRNIINDFRCEIKDGNDAALVSSSKLTINGNGVLEINTKETKGILSFGNLKILESNLNINSINSGIYVNGDFSLKNSNLVVTTGKSGVVSKAYDGAESSGSIIIENGNVKIDNKKGIEKFLADNYISISNSNVYTTSL